ncbi:MAG: hypothetical protein IT356_09020 [Gemmatimonadaceae bacterium]|nr:hypothetical protein [Gemmatimonadaceae bacterium]
MTTPPASLARALARSTAVAILTVAAMLSCLPGESPATAAADPVHDRQGRQDSAADRKKVAKGDSNRAAGDGPTAPRRPPNRDSIIDAMWPVKGPPPMPGSILPRKRIVAFYGNPLSTRMGVLGEYEPDEMLRRLDAEVAAWEAADPSMPVQPALHLIAVVAQGAPGRDGKYRLRMDSALIEKVAGWARKRDALMFLDIQVGHSTLREELPRLTPFLSRPNFHLGIDPEFSMKDGGLPGKKIGTYDAEDVNYAAAFLQDIVTKNGLPPKVLVVHRFTRKGLTNYRNIKLDPRVQIVIDMDGFGPPGLKKGTFRDYVRAEPVQFVGWKQFFKPKNDNPRTTIAEILKLWPRPVYIQYQ